MAAKKEAKTHKPGHLTVTAVAHDADGVQYTVCGCSVEEVQAAVEALTAPPQAAAGNPSDIQAEG